MMSAVKDLAARRFGKLTVISRAENSKSGKARWYCKCDCGKYVEVDGYNLRCGNTKSCGCLQRAKTIERNIVHGKSKTRIYRIYQHMVERCFSKSDKRYLEYGGRGITICAEWLSEHGFEHFYKWSVHNGYSDNLTIDRKDVNGNYEPLNCRWVSMKIQQNNRRNNHLITFQGVTKTLSQWSEVTGIKSLTILHRINSGWNTEKALFTPVRKR